MHYEERFGAREVKFLVTPPQAAAIRQWASARLEVDPHAAPGSMSYAVTSLYFDNDRFDVFYRRGSYGRAKYRVRRYGQSPSVFLERKMRTESTVAKRRCAVGLDEVQLIEADGEAAWRGAWFQRRLTARQLHPVCRIGYQRTAFVTRGDASSTARLTLDRGLEAVRIDAPVFGEAPAVAVMPESEILELKYAGAMPPVFKELLETFIVHRTPYSKYRAAMAALGIAA